jgi:hypothetical protein
MTVYLVLSGDYYEQGTIHGIFSTRERAEEWIKANGGVALGADIEEFTLDNGKHE